MQTSRVAELTVRLLRASVEQWPPLIVAHDVTELISKARSYQRLAETACNRNLTVCELKRMARSGQAIRDILARYGCGVSFEGDPRGYVVKIQFPSGASNTWGNDGWGIA